MDQLSASAVSAIRKLIADLVAGNYEGIVRDGRNGRLTRDDINRVVREYGRTLVDVPSEQLDKAEVYPTMSDREYSVDVHLWTIEGLSDLTLSLSIVDQPGNVCVSIDDLHVL